MREVDAVGGREVDVGHRHIQAFDLAERIAKLELGHVLAAGQFAPSRIRVWICGALTLAPQRGQLN